MKQTLKRGLAIALFTGATAIAPAVLATTAHAADVREYHAFGMGESRGGAINAATRQARQYAVQGGYQPYDQCVVTSANGYGQQNYWWADVVLRCTR
ncbi:hypothetical protein AB5J62_10320 [Amycolatopsis sp. cg5]|uniref:hypothetical protein n=1 Tax=Amycolatopsis sp. cg5 TaxID=3238802 RepID=UPI003525C4FE